LEGMHNAPAMLTRNALMACLVVIALGQRRHERYFWGTGICLSVALLMAQKRAAVADTDRDDGVQVAALPGMAIAQCSVRNGAGQTDSLANVLGPYGAVIAFAPTCAECRASLPFWRQVQARVEALGGRLVALAVSGGYTDARALLDQFGLGSVDLVSLVSVADGRRLGIGHLPHLIELDGRAHVRVATGQVRGIQLQAALQGAMESEDMLLALARALLPKLELRFVGPVLSTEAVVAGCVTGDEGRKLTVAIAMGWTPTGESAECVMVVDSQGRIIAVRPVSWGIRVVGLDDGRSSLARLDGLTLASATRLCDSLAAAGSNEGVWSLLGAMLRRLEAQHAILHNR